jgi:acetyl esterase
MKSKDSTMRNWILAGAVMHFQSLSAQSWWDIGPEAVRERINQRIMNIEAPTENVASVQDQWLQCGNRTTPIRIYTPVYTPGKGDRFPAILLIHGGAWVAGNLDTHDNLARYFCYKTQAIVISVGYLNSPEGKFPYPLEQCYDAFNWIHQCAKEFLVDASRIAIVGDSAGGNMAAALCLMIRDRNASSPTLQVLINPAPDLTCNGTLERKGDNLDLLRWQAIQYASDLEHASHPYASPLMAKTLNDLPSALVILAENDDLREAGQNYAARLRASGISTQVYCQNGIGHLAGDGARASIRARESLDVAVAAFKKAFSNDQNNL